MIVVEGLTSWSFRDKQRENFNLFISISVLRRQKSTEGGSVKGLFRDKWKDFFVHNSRLLDLDGVTPTMHVRVQRSQSISLWHIFWQLFQLLSSLKVPKPWKTNPFYAISTSHSKSIKKHSLQSFSFRFSLMQTKAAKNWVLMISEGRKMFEISRLPTNETSWGFREGQFIT